MTRVQPKTISLSPTPTVSVANMKKNALLPYIKRWFETPKKEQMTHSDPRLLMRKPLWLVQTVADLDRHEGFRAFAYPDPLSKLGQKYRGRKWKWGFEPGEHLLVRYGEREIDGRPWTVGYGFTRGVNPSTQVSKERARQILEQEILVHVEILDYLIPRWRQMPVVVQTVLANMAYNMGGRLKQFKNTLAVIEAGRYEEAGERLKHSLWYKQVGTRAKELIARLQTGEIDERFKVI